MSLSLRWTRPGTGGHDDLTLRLGEYEHVCDSYYFAIDREDGERPGTPREQVASVIVDLLAQWLRAIDRLADGATCYLPFDFSDQCTAWVQATRKGNGLTLRAGWSLLEGYGVSPSKYDDVQPTDWKPIDKCPSLPLSIEGCKNAIGNSMLLLRQRRR